METRSSSPQGSDPTRSDSFTKDGKRANLLSPDTAALRDIASDLRDEHYGAESVALVEAAAAELDRLRDLNWRDLRFERGIEDEARLIVHRLDELASSSDHIRALAIVDALARAEMRGYERARLEQAPIEAPHRGMDWAAARMAVRS